MSISKTKKSQKFSLQVNEQVNEILWIRGVQTCPLYIWDLKITWTWQWRKRGFAEKAWSEDTATLAGKQQIKVQQVALSARLTREDKVTLSCVNSMTSFRKNGEVLLDWYLNDVLLEENFVLPAMTPVSLNTTEFLRGKLEGTIGVQVISCLPDFPPFHCSCFKIIWFCHENFPYLVEILILRPLHHWTEREQKRI